MLFSKSIPIGDVGSLVISEDAGVAKLLVSFSASLGSGAAAGVVKGAASVEVDVAAQHLIDLGLELAAAKFPAVASLIEVAKAGIDAELSKV